MLSGDVVFALILAGIFLCIVALLLVLRRTIAGYREGVEESRQR